MRLTALLISLSLPVAAQADLIAINWVEGAFVHKATISPKKFLEVCGMLKKGENINWRFNANAPADFNIHYHVGDDVVEPENRKGIAKAEGAMLVVLNQDYCWMWRNREATPVDVEVQLNRLVPRTK